MAECSHIFFNPNGLTVNGANSADLMYFFYTLTTKNRERFFFPLQSQNVSIMCTLWNPWSIKQKKKMSWGITISHFISSSFCSKLSTRMNIKALTLTFDVFLQTWCGVVTLHRQNNKKHNQTQGNERNKCQLPEMQFNIYLKQRQAGLHFI